MAFRSNAPRKLEKMMFMRGGLRRTAKGMIGRPARDSAYKKAGKPTAKITRDE
jgi:hypothetical protein